MDALCIWQPPKVEHLEKAIDNKSNHCAFVILYINANSYLI